jgi:hypothetical protein
MLFPFWPHKVEDKSHVHVLFFHYYLQTCLDFRFSPFSLYIIWILGDCVSLTCELCCVCVSWFYFHLHFAAVVHSQYDTISNA